MNTYVLRSRVSKDYLLAELGRLDAVLKLMSRDAEAAKKLLEEHREAVFDLLYDRVTNPDILDQKLETFFRGSSKRVRDLGFRLARRGTETVRDLVQLTKEELLQYRSVGETSLWEVRALLEENGLGLGMRLQPDA